MIKLNKLPIRILLLAILSLSFNSLIFAQKIALPAGLTKESSLEEILDWLNKRSFAQARIGLNSDAYNYSEDTPRLDTDGYSEQGVFSQGFKIAEIDGCKLTLRNDDIKLLSFSTANPNPANGSLSDFISRTDKQSQYAGELFIPLQKLKAKKAPYPHTKKADRADLLGTWRVEFTKKFEFFLIPTRKRLKSLLENTIKVEIIGGGQNGRNDSMSGDTLTFTFDNKQMSEDFYAAFRQAVTLCKDE